MSLPPTPLRRQMFTSTCGSRLCFRYAVGRTLSVFGVVFRAVSHQVVFYYVLSCCAVPTPLAHSQLPFCPDPAPPALRGLGHVLQKTNKKLLQNKSKYGKMINLVGDVELTPPGPPGPPVHGQGEACSGHPPHSTHPFHRAPPAAHWRLSLLSSLLLLRLLLLLLLSLLLLLTTTTVTHSAGAE